MFLFVPCKLADKKEEIKKKDAGCRKMVMYSNKRIESDMPIV